jgi:hypothetical protein
MAENIKFKLKNGKTHEMTLQEMTRWACLLEGIEEVTKRSNILGISPDDDSWIQPLAFKKYIDERFHSMLHDLTVEQEMGRL